MTTTTAQHQVYLSPVKQGLHQRRAAPRACGCGQALCPEKMIGRIYIIISACSFVADDRVQGGGGLPDLAVFVAGQPPQRLF
jgi:hypothetical protein